MRMHKPCLVILPLITLLMVGCTEQDEPTAPAPSESRFSTSRGSSLATLDGKVVLAIAELINRVEGLETADALNKGQARALRNHLENARRHFQENRYDPAQAQLVAFRQQVNEFVADEVLTPADALPLLEGVGRIELILPTCRDRAGIEQMLEESLEDEQQRPWLDVSVMLPERMDVHESFPIFVRLDEAGQPLVNADVQADMHTPHGIRNCVTVHLLDNGTSADESAGDGEYAAVFPAPKVPGVYVFVVTVNGVDEQGSPFTRVKLLSRLADVSPSDARGDGGDGIDGPRLPWLGEPPREWTGS